MCGAGRDRNPIESGLGSLLPDMGVRTMSTSKKYLKTRPVSKVTFKVPREIAAGASKASLVGEFNDWDPQATRMRKLKTGEFKVTVDLEVGREYQFRYLLDDRTWQNDESADRYVPAGIPDAENSVIVV
jgi:1,4-alpha-glucan branching enzyme